MKENGINGKAASVRDTVALPHVTVLSELPEKLQPKAIDLSTMAQPLTIAVPAKSGGSYALAKGNGEVDKIMREPPKHSLLSVLRDVNGEVIYDNAHSPFIMGEGGLSDFTTFTTNNGLPLDVVYSSLKDHAGNLWFGTNGGGVCRYDGVSFTTFSSAQGLANNDVRCIAEDKNGNIWFATNGGGASRYDGRSFTTFSTAQGLANNLVRTIAVGKQGDLWFGTRGGVSRYDGKTFTNFSTANGLGSDVIFSTATDRAGNIWFGTMDGGVSRYDGKSFTTFTISQGLPRNSVRSIAEDKEGNMWFGTIEGGACRYDGKSFTTFSTADGLAGNTVVCITEDSKGSLWFGTEGGGASRYDALSSPRTGANSFTTYSSDQGLANNRVICIVEDKSGNLWFGTNGGGVSRYNGRAFTIFSTAHGLAFNNVRSITEDRTGNLWFGTEGGGVSYFDGRSFTNYGTGQGLINNKIGCIAMDKQGNLWIGSEGSGAIRFDGHSFTTFSVDQGLANNGVESIKQDKAGNLWFGTYGGGASRYDGRSFTTFSVEQGLANNLVEAIAEDRVGNLWFGTLGGGVSRFDGKSFITFSTSQGLANNWVHCIFCDSIGNLWFGTDGGLSMMAADDITGMRAKMEDLKGKHGSSYKLIKTFTKADGLPDNSVYQIAQLHDKRIAAGTNLGITLFTPSLDFTRLNDIEIYNSVTGYPVKDLNEGQNCMFVDSKGILWAGTGSEKTALVRFVPAALRSGKDAPLLNIRGINVNVANICWNDLRDGGGKGDSNMTPPNITEEVTTLGRKLTDGERDSMRSRFRGIKFDGISPFYPIPEHLVLPYRYNNITIDFGVVETGKPGLVQYSYMLEGYDKDWSAALKKTSATFGNIGEGTYVFKMKAQGPNGAWCAPVTYTFQVLPPLYRTWWAYVLYALLFFLVLKVFVKQREKSLQIEKEKLENTVKERTEELVQKNKIVEKQKTVLEEQKAVVEKEKHRSEELLLNILPEEVAEELKTKGRAEAKLIDQVTVMFTDFKGFTEFSEKLSPQALVEVINNCFSSFDRIMEKHGVEKIKTIGDSYMAAGGLPSANKTHSQDVVSAAMEIQNYMVAQQALKDAAGEPFFEIRIGIHTGPVVAGIVGVKKFQYDIWGDTVNTASRFERNCEAGKINISEVTYELVKNTVKCYYRGEIQVKGKGMMKMYYVG